MLAIDLSLSRCRFTCTGPDATRYLNGQVTQDIRGVTQDQSLPACLTSAKGKLEAELVVAAIPAGYLLDAPASLREMLGPRLEKYLIADDCVITDVTDGTGQFHFAGTSVPGLPAGSPRSSRWGLAGWDVVVPLAEAAGIRALVPGTAVAAGAWNEERIRRGIPIWGAELDTNTLPPEAGLEATHISYAKGCYIGQEVISRLRGVGQVTRKLCQLSPAGPGTLVVGMAVHGSPAPAADARPLGTVTSATSDGRIALAFIRRPHHLGESLLYALPNDGSSLSIAVHIRPCPLQP